MPLIFVQNRSVYLPLPQCELLFKRVVEEMDIVGR